MLNLASIQSSTSIAAPSTLLQSKQAKLSQDSASISAGMQEAAEKASNLMSAAMTGMVMGIVSGAASVAGAAAAGGFVGSGDVLRAGLANSLAGDLSFHPGSFKLNRKSDSAESKQAAADKAAAQADESSKSASESRDRRKAGMDSIQKFLDIMRSMNPRI